MKFYIPLFLLVIFFSCKKEAIIERLPSADKVGTTFPALKIPPVTNTGTGGNNRALTTSNGVYQLVSIGNGYYQVGYSNQGTVTLKVYNLSYPVGTPKNGDPIKGTLSIPPPDNGGSTISVQPSGPISSFDVSQIIAGLTTTTFNFTSYNNAETKYFNDLKAYDSSGDPKKTRPTAPFIKDYLSTSQVGSNAVIQITGRLMRDSIGSTFALAREDYPLPTPPAPLPYTVNEKSISFTPTVTTSNGLKTVKLTDNKTNNYIPTFTFVLTSTNQLHQINTNTYDISSTYSNTNWSQATSNYPDITTPAPNTIAFGLVGRFDGITITSTLLANYITYNYITNTLTISYNDSNYLTWFQNNVE